MAEIKQSNTLNNFQNIFNGKQPIFKQINSNFELVLFCSSYSNLNVYATIHYQIELLSPLVLFNFSNTYLQLQLCHFLYVILKLQFLFVDNYSVSLWQHISLFKIYSTCIIVTLYNKIVIYPLASWYSLRLCFVCYL